MIEFDIALDLFPLLAGTLAAMTCGLLGNFLVLRKLSLMGDAISHSVLPGLVVAFLLGSSRSPLVMFLGAAVAGIATVVLVELVKKVGRVEPGAAMGVVFSILFAFGVLLIEQAARHVDLDADCVLHGELEALVWYTPPRSAEEYFQARTWVGYTIQPEVFDPDTGQVLSRKIVHEGVPRQVVTLLAAFGASILLIVVLFKELRIAAFDPSLSTTLGFNSTLLHYVLMIAVAGATVASFEAVGSILVIAMLICPAATARLLTDRLRTQLYVSLLIAAFCGIVGYLAATAIPSQFEKDSVNAAGSIAMVAGLVLTFAIVLSPSHGVLVKTIRRHRLGRTVDHEDLLATLYRLSESGEVSVSVLQLQNILILKTLSAVVGRAKRDGDVEVVDDLISLTAKGQRNAERLIRKHRMWESYLVEHAGLLPDHVHSTAERLEHLEVSPERGPDVDPHGKLIPDRD